MWCTARKLKRSSFFEHSYLSINNIKKKDIKKNFKNPDTCLMREKKFYFCSTFALSFLLLCKFDQVNAFLEKKTFLVNITQRSKQ